MHGIIWLPGNASFVASFLIFMARKALNMDTDAAAEICSNEPQPAANVL
jgi:hypothetical protein